MLFQGIQHCRRKGVEMKARRDHEALASQSPGSSLSIPVLLIGYWFNVRPEHAKPGFEPSGTVTPDPRTPSTKAKWNACWTILTQTLTGGIRITADPPDIQVRLGAALRADLGGSSQR
jgi:hypothetical protein